LNLIPGKEKPKETSARADLFRIFFPIFSEPPNRLDFSVTYETGYAFEPKKFSKNFNRLGVCFRF
jgi:hypothetical protein